MGIALKNSEFFLKWLSAMHMPLHIPLTQRIPCVNIGIASQRPEAVEGSREPLITVLRTTDGTQYWDHELDEIHAHLTASYYSLYPQLDSANMLEYDTEISPAANICKIQVTSSISNHQADMFTATHPVHMPLFDMVYFADQQIMVLRNDIQIKSTATKQVWVNGHSQETTLIWPTQAQLSVPLGTEPSCMT